MTSRFAKQFVGLFLVVLAVISFAKNSNAFSEEDRPTRMAQQSFEEFKQQRREGMQDRREKFQQYLEERSEAYREFYEKRQRKFEKFKEEIASKWGKRNVEVSTKKTMTSYSEDKTERNSVDFEEGEAQAEVLVDAEAAQKNPEKVKEKLKSEVEDMVTKSSVEDEVADVDTQPEQPQAETDPGPTPEQPEPTRPEDPSNRQEKATPQELPTPERKKNQSQQKKSKDEAEATYDEPILAGQLQTDDGEDVDKENADEFAEDVTAEEKVKTETVTGEDGETRVKASVEVDLVSDHTEKRARKYLDRVKKQADRFDVDPGVLLAVMHTESSFNPKARSPIPAFGLMQLVPGSGGKAAYKHIYGEERLLKPDYLYQPANNIELGAGYLNLVYDRYLDGIENERSRLYCAIASYNTGPGNLAKTFVDSMSVNEAEEVINTMTPEEVYRKLREDLPYDETKHYIKRVRDRRETYEKWLAQAGSV